MDKAELSQFANSGLWEKFRDEVLEVRLMNVKDVTKGLDTEFTITPQDAYLGKVLAAEYIKNLIGFVNSHKVKKPVDRKKNSFE